MKIFTTLVTFAAAAALLTSCSQETTETSGSSSYPLKNCVVSGEPLGSMGDQVIINHNGTEVRFCCKDCIKDFNSDPEKYLSKIK